MAEGVRELEYKFLRGELDTNKRFIFERPLLIVGTGLTLAAAFGEARGFEFAPAPLLALLTFNLWFTFNRLRSNARIIAYIQLFHEGTRPPEWIGWESALRRYRIWCSTHKEEARQIRQSTDENYDNAAFYRPIFFFHLLAGVGAAAVLVLQSDSFASLRSCTAARQQIAILALNGVALLVFGFFCTRFPLAEVQRGIEVNRLLWERIWSDKSSAQRTPPVEV